MTAAHRLALVAALSLCAAGGHADESFRCGKWVITSEMAVDEIISKCGPPATRQSRTEDVRIRNRNTGLMMTTGQITIETLTWDRGPGAAPMVVTVVEGRTKSVERKP